MRLTRLGPALLAALAALLLAAGLTPASPSEAADEIAEVETITTVLHPGWNMVGWVGPTAPVWHLFEEIGALRVVATHDETTRDYRYAWPSRQDEFPMLTPGLGLWLYVSGDTPVRWTRPAVTDGAVVRLRAGRNLAGVAADGGPRRVETGVLTPLGSPMFTRVFRRPRSFSWLEWGHHGAILGPFTRSSG